MLEKSNTWPEQVLDTLNSCWRALLESLSNTQANVGSWSLVGGGLVGRGAGQGVGGVVEGGCLGRRRRAGLRQRWSLHLRRDRRRFLRGLPPSADLSHVGGWTGAIFGLFD